MDEAELASDFEFLGAHLEDDFSWSIDKPAMSKRPSRDNILSDLRSNHVTQNLLVMVFCKEHLDLLSVCVVQQLYSSRQEKTPVSHQHGSNDHSLFPALLAGVVQCPLPEEGTHILQDSSHLGRSLFQLLLQVEVSEQWRPEQNSFYAKAITEMNFGLSSGK